MNKCFTFGAKDSVLGYLLIYCFIYFVIKIWKPQRWKKRQFESFFKWNQICKKKIFNIIQTKYSNLENLMELNGSLNNKRQRLFHKIVFAFSGKICLISDYSKWCLESQFPKNKFCVCIYLIYVGLTFFSFSCSCYFVLIIMIWYSDIVISIVIKQLI